MKCQRYFLLVALSFLLVGCNGYAPLLTCRSPCSDAKETRDSFCVCQDYTNVGVLTPPAPPQTSDRNPYLFSESIQDRCTFQKNRWIFNPRSERVDVLIGRKQRDGSLTGTTKYFWYTVEKWATTKATSVALGLEYDGSDCFDRDTFISKWRKHDSGSLLVASEASLQSFNLAKADSAPPELDPEAEQYASLLESILINDVREYSAKRDTEGLRLKFGLSGQPEIKLENKLIERRDCALACSSPRESCFRNFPPERSKVVALRNKILATKSGTSLESSDLYSIFGIPADSCKRANSELTTSNKVLNDGDPCAYTMFLQETDRTPAAAIHMGRNVTGDTISGARGASVMFNKPYAMPALAFGSKILNQAYGGTIFEISADGKGVYINAGSSCTSFGLVP